MDVADADVAMEGGARQGRHSSSSREDVSSAGSAGNGKPVVESEGEGAEDGSYHRLDDSPTSLTEDIFIEQEARPPH